MEEEIIYFYNVKDGKYYQSRYTHRWLNNLQQQCKKQKEVIDKIDKYIKPLITNRDDEQYYAINWYNKDVLLSMLKEVE